MTSLKNPTAHQRRILEILLSKYESSRTFSGQNKVTQTFSVKPEDVFPDYSDDFTDTALISRFEEEVLELERAGLAAVERDRRGISRIIANKDAMSKYPALLGVADKRTTLNEAEEILRGHLGGHEYVRRLCGQQLERVAAMKKPDLAPDNVRLEQVLRCLDYILGNRSEILERELSIELFGDSKLFEKTVRSRVCTLLVGAVDDKDLLAGECEKSLREARILEYFSVVRNPTYFYFKGDCEIRFTDGTSVPVSRAHPIALCSSSVGAIVSAETPCREVMTVENLTSFNRVQGEDTLFVYLSGYNDSPKTRFLRKLREDNPGKTWLHFGDIDPDGFYILSNLRKKTGIEFAPFLMGTEELEAYRDYCKPLEPNDVAKARSLIAAGEYPGVMEYLLAHNCKLEQEIISWKRANNASRRELCMI